MLRYIPGALVLLISLQCSADLRVNSPNEACTLLTDSHLRAGEWSKAQGGREGCQSTARLLSVKNSSMISFSVDGIDNKPLKVRLLLDVASADDVDPAKRELVKATKRLAVRALGLSIPFPVEESIMKGTPIRLALGLGTLTITRTANINGGYQMAVVME